MHLNNDLASCTAVKAVNIHSYYRDPVLGQGQMGIIGLLLHQSFLHFQRFE